MSLAWLWSQTALLTKCLGDKFVQNADPAMKHTVCMHGTLMQSHTLGGLLWRRGLICSLIGIQVIKSLSAVTPNT